MEVLIEEFKKLFPLRSDSRELVIENIYVDKSKVDPSDFAYQKDIKLEGKSLMAPVYADVKLLENGKVISSRRRMLIGRIPVKIPDRGTYIYNGNEFFISNQFRLKPGIYTRIRENGEVESYFNLAKWSFRLVFRGDKIYAKFSKGPYIPVYTILKLFGAKEEDIKEALGSLYEANVDYNEDAIEKWFAAYYGDRPDMDPVKTFKSILTTGYRLDPEVTNQLLGLETTSLNADVVLRAVKKLIKLRKGEIESDDRDALFYKEIYTPDDLLREFGREAFAQAARKIKRNMNLKDDVRDVLPTSIFQDVINKIFQKDLVNPLKETNPVTILENNLRVTIFGEGGIKSEYSVPFQARAVNPSHFGIVDPVRTPESSKVGTVLFRTLGSAPEKLKPKVEVIDVKKKKRVKISPIEFYNSRVAFPDQIESIEGTKVKFKSSQVKVLHKGYPAVVSPSEVDYVVPKSTHLFTVSTALIPFLNAVHPNRASKAANTITQALPLKDPEPPLVQVAYERDISMEDVIGSQFSVRSPVSGTVKKITKNYIIIKDSKGKEHKVVIPEHVPLNQHSYLDASAYIKVREGDKVRKGQLLADTNFTREGTLAIGKNALVALIPYKGLNFEDGIVVSESFAKKLTSRRLFTYQFRLTEDVIVDKEKYRALYPYEMTQERYNKLDKDGVIKVGETVEEGDILVAGLRKKKDRSQVDEVIFRLARRYYQDWVRASIKWDREVKGVVKDVKKTKNMITVTVLTEEPAVVGDKVVNRQASKGVIVHIVPDDQMPKTEDGRTVEVIINPVSLLGRNNPAQVYEMIAGKVAEKTGTPFKIPNFEKIDDVYKFVNDMAKKFGVKDTETLIDPETGKRIPGVLVGPMYMYKLEHQVEEKLSARYRGAYDQWDLTPAKGVEEPGQAIGLLEIYSLLSHGAESNLQEMTVWKSQKNPAFWEAIENNLPPPAPKVPFVTQKLEALLKAAGVNVDKKGHEVRIFPMTASHIKELTKNNEVKNAKTVIAGTLKEEEGGLFDPKITGGLEGEKWSYIKLPFKIMNPMFLKAAAAFLNMPESKIEKILLEKETLDGETGEKAILKKLKSKSLDEYIKEAEELAKTTKDPAVYNRANLVIRFAKRMKELNLTFDEFFFDRFPVLPPRFRPVAIGPKNQLITSDFNLLYRDIMLYKQFYEEGKQEGLPKEDLLKLKESLYDSIKALQGLTEPTSRYFGKRVPRGILDYIAGEKPKEGYFQFKVLRKIQDLSGRSVIIPNPSLHPDELGVPEEMAWRIFQPFILQKLKTHFGLSPAEARVALAERDHRARQALELVASERLVLMNRAPSLFKTNIMAFKPKIIPGNAIEVPNIVVAMQGGDYDGDHQNSTIILSINKNAFSLDNSPPDWYLRLQHSSGGVDIASYIKQYIPIEQNCEVYVVDLADFPHSEEAFRKDGRIFYHVPEGVRVLAFDELSGKVIWVPVKYWSVHPEREIYVVNTYYGKQIFTDDDPRAIYGIVPETLEFSRATPSEALEKKMLIPVVKKFHVKGTLSSIDLKPYTDRARHNLVDRKNLTYEFGYFLGYFIGNGWVSYVKDQPKSINIAMHVDLIGSDLENLLTKEMASLIAGEPRISKHVFEKREDRFEEAYRITLTSIEAAYLFDEWVGRGAFNKHLPGFFLVANEQFRRGLLTGYLDADGSFGISRAKKNPQLMINASTASLRLAREIVLLAKSLGITANISSYTGTFSGKQHWMITFSSHELLASKLEFKNPKHLAKIREIPFIKESGAKAKTDLVPFNSYIYRELALPYLSRSEQSSYRRRAKDGYISRYLALKLIDRVGVEVFLNDNIGKRWLALVYNKNISWSPIRNVERTGNVEIGYDLTVPGFETFMNVEGLILSNTTAIHVPVTQEALQEAFKMLPSENWLHEGKPDQLWLTPKIESVWGLYKITQDGKDKSRQFKFKTLDEARKAYHEGKVDVTDFIIIGNTKTTLGRALVNDILPQKYRDPNIKLTRQKINDMLKQIFKEYGSKKGAEIAGKLSKLGYDFAFYTGSSLSLKDLEPKFDDILEKASMESLKLPPDKVAQKAAQLRKNIMDKLLREDNALTQLIKSGTRANKDALMQLKASPIQLADVYDRPIPFIVPRGYNKGMDTISYLFASYGARKGAIEKTVRTGEPGALSKEMVAAAIDYVITMDDCKTKNGILRDVDDFSIINRVLAEDVYKNGKKIVSRNTVIDENVFNKLKSAKIDKVKIRSPVTCEAPDGICQMCYGKKPNGEFPAIGEYVGVKSAQYLTEPVTQMTISSVHTGGLVKDIGTSFDDIKNVLEMRNASARATVAKTSGKVTKIDKRPEGGYSIFIDDVEHITSPWVEPKVKVGDEVKKGDIITSGLPNPKDIYQVAGVDSARMFVLDYLDKAYQANGVKLDKRHFEVATKVMFDTVRITDPGDTEFVIGDYVKMNKVRAENASLPTVIELAVEDAEGRKLAEPVAGLSRNKVLTKEDIDMLKRKRVKIVKVYSKPATYEPIIRALEQIPLFRDDWLTRMGYRQIKDTVIEGALRSWASDLTGYSPIPKLVYGTFKTEK